MNRQRKVIITVTYNDLGIIVDTKAEELDLSAQPNLQPTCNDLATDTISRQAAIDAVAESLENVFVEARDVAEKMIGRLPSAQQEEAIPFAWLEEQAKWFESMDNAFAKIEANNIRVMIKKWRREQNERFDFTTGGD